MGPKIATACLVLAALACAALAPSAGAMDLGRLIAPESVCPNQDRLEAPAAVQEQAMRCMTDFARQRRGMAGLADAANLDRSAVDKARDIIRCDDFSHTACGRSFSYWMQRVGYIPARCWRVGENLAWGSGELGTVRAIFRGWIYSPNTGPTSSAPTPRSAPPCRSAASKGTRAPISGFSTSAVIAPGR